MGGGFSTYHPLVIFTWFACVLLLTMALMNPYFLAVSFAASFLYSFALKGRGAIKFNLLFALPFFAVLALINPLFFHQGATPLLYINDSPVTLESILYGAASAGMLVSVLLWFTCYTQVMTTDKFLYLFGSLAPTFSLLISMTLRLIPEMKNRIAQINKAQKAIGMDPGGGSPGQRAKHGIRILSALVTWSLESGVETADSMKARGYGLRGRTSFSLYRFRGRDAACLAAIGIFVLLVLAGAAAGALDFSFYPYMKQAPFTLLFTAAWANFLFLCLLPLLITFVEGVKWLSLKSKI